MEEPALTAEAYRHMKRPHHAGALSAAQYVGRSGENQGPFYQIYLREDAGIVVEASFETYCCPWATAIGSALVKRVEGKKVDEVGKILPEDVERDLSGVPRGKRHLAVMAVAALRDALKQRA